MRGELRTMESMAKHTSWKAGGAARRFYRPADRQDLIEFLSSLDADEKLEWVGLGSNLLVRDGGFDGTVIHSKGCLKDIDDVDATKFRAEAGVSCAVAARHAARQGLVGLEYFAGIPGTVGGALAMNAGAFNGETWNNVISVEMINHQGDVVEREPAEFDIHYRYVKRPLQHEWFLSATFQLEKGDAGKAQAQIRQLLDKRAASQPIGEASCGSTFKNPQGDHAARLIEAAGLKGYCMGNACISTKHANFLINQGGATATQIEALADYVEERVYAYSGIRLEREFHVIGDRLKESGHVS